MTGKRNYKNDISILTILATFFFLTSVWSQDQMTSKLMMGYQGWFFADGDSSGPDEWRHWFNGRIPSAAEIGIDYWPEMSEYSDTYDTEMNYVNGSNAMLFSSHDLSTTRKHFQWMRDYNIHGVHLQRFLGELRDNRFFRARNNILQNVITSAAEYDRHFSVMYDLSGVADDGNLYTKLISDWEYLVDTYDMLNAQGYVKEDSRPVVAIWGIGFKNRGLTTTTFEAIINYFHNTADPKYRAYVMGGVPDGWRTLSGSSEEGAGWSDVYNSLDMISPWTVGRYSNTNAIDNWKNNFIVPDLQECTSNGVDYMPVIWPGFSWVNIHDGPYNQIPRSGGEFYWRQAYNAIEAGSKYIYVAMFDEVDEGTAMFKLAETQADLPVGPTLVPLDVDGIKLPSDWYLQLADQTQQMLDGSIPLTSTIPILPNVTGNIAEFVSMQNVPVAMNLGESITVGITMKNTGTTTWTQTKGFKLGSEKPLDNTFWGSNRVSLQSQENITPGSEKNFEFEITAPSIAGNYNFQWKMIQESIEYFGTASLNQIIVVGGIGDYLDDCDSKLDWIPSALIHNNNDQVQGIGCLEYIGSSVEEFKKVFATSYNANGTESGTVLQFWYYVSDPSQFQNSNQVEIGSSGKADTDEYNWKLSGLVSGWNFITLNTVDAGKVGNPDLSAINWFRLYRKKDGGVTTRIDAIQLIGENSLSISEIVDEKLVTLFPNPANTEVYVSFTISNPSAVSITLMNINGQIISQPIHKSQLDSGKHIFEVALDDLKPGIYFARIKIGNRTDTKKIIIN